jgi:hypothetical protein
MLVIVCVEMATGVLGVESSNCVLVSVFVSALCSLRLT